MYKFIKKIEDLIFAFSILAIFSPVLFLITIISLFMQGLPIFYVSKRMIKSNKEIKILKFRTMIKDAKDPKYELEKKYMIKGYLDIPLESEVYTPLGRFLEKSQIVETPQLLHIFFGKISFIGNRPLPRHNVEIVKKNFPDKWHLRFDSPAGLTGISQVVGKFNLTPEERIEIESLYSEVYNNGNILKADAYIFFSTIILLILRNPSAYRSYNISIMVLKSCLKK